VSAKGEGVDVDYRDFTPVWHARTLAIVAAALGLALAVAWKAFL
jgi:hypothetical protein